MNLAERLRERRERRGLKNSQVATYLGLSTAHVSYLEGGKREPSLDLLVRLAEYYRCSVDYLLGLTDDPRPPDKQSISQAAVDAINLIDSLPADKRPSAVALLRAIIVFSEVGVRSSESSEIGEIALPEPVPARQGGGVTIESGIDNALQQKVRERKDTALALLKRMVTADVYEEVSALVNAGHLLTEAETVRFVNTSRRNSLQQHFELLGDGDTLSKG